MKTKVQKGISLLLSLVLLVSLCSFTVSAEYSSVALTYDLNVNGENSITVQRGQEITVNFTLRSPSAYQTFVLQNEIEYDTDFFEIGTDENNRVTSNKGTLVQFQQRTTNQQIVKCSNSGAKGYEPVELLCSFKLKVKESPSVNTTTVRNSESIVYETSTKEITNLTLQNLTVTLGETPVTAYSVTFHANGGEGTMAVQTFNAGEEKALSANAFTRTDYVFNGWSTNADGSGTNYSNGQSITLSGDTDLYAQWTQAPVTHTVTFDANGGTGTMAAQTVTANSETALTANVFTREGYTFNGWNTAADGNGTTYTNGQSVTLTADLTLYAQWSQNATYTATFSGGEGATGTAPANITGTNITLPANPFSRTGYHFTGWNDGSNTYQPNASYTLTQNTAFTAQWSGNSVTVTLNPGTGAHVTVQNPFTATVGQPITLNGNMVARDANDGYTFAGWTIEGDDSTSLPASYAIPATDATTLRLVAHWNEPGTCTVTFHGNGIDVSGTMASQDFLVDVPQALNRNTFTRAGYNFAGWNTAINGSGTAYVDGATITISDSITLYAQWTARPAVNVSYVISMPVSTAAAATLGANAPTTALPGTTITLPTATHRSYTLQGWRMGNSTQVLPVGSTVTINAATIFTAVWGDHTHVDAALTSAVATRYIHNDGTSTHIHRDTTTTTCLDCGQTVGSPVNADTNENCVGTVGNQWLSNSTQHWHYCTTEGAAFDAANHTYVNGVCSVCGYGTPTGGGEGGGESGGTSVITRINGGTTTGTAIENPSGGTTTIVEEEVPLAGVDNLVLVTVNDPTTGATASGSRNEDGSIKITVKDVSGAEVLSIPGGVRAEIHGVTTGQVVVIIDPATGEILDLVEKSLVEGQVAYTLLDGSVTIRIIDNAKPFDDVMPYDWFNDSVIFASSHELFNGTAERIFEPNTPMSRGMLVTVLWRLENKPNDFSENVFSDVENGTWYTDPVRWATKNGIVKGYDDGTFRPNKEITREEMAAILYRYMDYLKYNVTGRNDLSAYTDASGVAQWALENVQWAVDAGIITGVTADTIQPQTTATRAQVATMFQRIVTGMVK